ncbi:MAG TPA: TcpE family conjugal transfer membrane protein [Trebonia sp.]|nr:TcpE family conjugal transfer membrane protein [Trebonia sp.]
MDLPTYTNIWRIEKRLYKLYDFRLPMPLPINWIAVFTGITVPYIVLLIAIGVPFNHSLLWLYVLPPGLLTWLTTRPVIEGKRLPELVESQVRYLSEPRTWVRLTPLSEKDQMALSARVWRGRTASERMAVAAAAASNAGAPAALGAARGAAARRSRPKTRVPAIALNGAPVPVRDHGQPTGRTPRPARGQVAPSGTVIRPRVLALGPGGGGRPTPALPPTRPGPYPQASQQAPARPPVIPAAVEGAPVRVRGGAPGAPYLEVSHDRPARRPAPAEPPAPPVTARLTAARPAAARPETTLLGGNVGNSWPSPARPLRPVRTAPAPTEQGPAEAAPANRVPADTAPVQATEFNATPIETPPAEAPPVVVTPVETPPAEAPPVVVAPVETPLPQLPLAHTALLETAPAAAPHPAAPAEAASHAAQSAEAAPVAFGSVAFGPVAFAPVEPAPAQAARPQADPAHTALAATAPVQDAPEEAEFRQVAPAEPAPEEVAPQQVAPVEAAQAEAVPEEVAPEHVASVEAASEEAAPEEAPPEEAPLQQVAPVQPAPEETAPEQSTSVEALPGQALPGQTLPDQAAPEQAPSETVAAPEWFSSVEAALEQPKPTTPPETAPVEPVAAKFTPTEFTPTEFTPAEFTPAEFRPVEFRPVEPWRPETWPTQVTPAEAPAAEIPIAEVPQAPPVPVAEFTPAPVADLPRLEHSHEPAQAAPVAAVQETQNRAVPSIERALSGPAREQNPSWHGKVKIVTGAGASHGPGARDQEALDRNRARLDVPEPRRILVLGATSGAGQTVTALMTGYMLASLREHPVAVVDLHDGTLARYRAPAAWLDEILAGRPPQQVLSARPDGLNPTPKPNPARLDVIASHQQPRDGDEIKLAVQLNRHYPLTVLDPGPAFLTRLLKITDQLAVVVPANAEAAGALADTRDWLDNNGHAELAMQSVTVINGVSRRSLPDVEHAESIARGRSRAIVRIPWDDMLPVAAAGPSTLRPQTRVAYTALAGVLVAGLAAVPVRKRQ